ncbi:lipopolysaccharide assembly protein LapB [Sphingomonas sp. NFR15]|uniref:tetratricopeptide repeat protein n=1 Tax=Sphingomonas sp. NFR15 TaxID=1566282 RepID=UPI0015A013D6|nr:hypothetical protein [Sphingomonas sp. NFR15]
MRTRTRRVATRAERVRAGVLIGAALLAGAGIAAVDFAADASVVPEVAVQVDPRNSDVLTTLAENSARDDLDAAHAYALRAIASNPLDDRALVIAALARTSTNEIARADRLFGLVTQLTRRQPLAETWMFDLSADRGDYAGAIDHADAALRRHTVADTDVMPVMIRITATPGALPALARKLATMPPWRTDFFQRLARSKEGDGLALIGALRQAGDRTAPVEVAAMASQQIAAGSTAKARAVWRTGFGSPLPPLLSPNFESMVQYGDFGWTFGVRGGAQIVARGGSTGGTSGHALEVQPSRTGKRPVPVAQQAMLLDRGGHRITFEGRGVGGGGQSVASVVVRCAGTDQELGRASVPAGPSWTTAGFGFFVPASDCPIQKLVIEAVPNLTQGGSPTLIDTFRVE